MSSVAVPKDGPVASSSSKETNTSTAALPPVIYIRTQDADTLFAVQSRFFTEPGTLPDHSLLRHMFDGRTKTSVPMGHRDGIPIFHVSMPVAVFSHMLHGFNLPHMWDHINDNLPGDDRGVSPELWEQYVEYFGVVGLPCADDDATTEDRCRKRKRANDEDDATAARNSYESRVRRLVTGSDIPPTFEFYRRLAFATANHIRASHPGWNTFALGAESTLVCEFISTYHPQTSVDGDRTYRIVVEGDPPIEPVAIAYKVGIALENQKGFSDTKPSLEYFYLCVAHHLDATKFNVTAWMLCTRNTRQKKPIQLHHWPAGRVDLTTPRDHDVFAMRITHAVAKTE